MPKNRLLSMQNSPIRNPKTAVELRKNKTRQNKSSINLTSYKRVTRFGIPLYILISAVAILFLLFSILFFKDLPAPASLTNVPVAQTTKILDRNGKLLYNIYVSENRTVVPISEIPQSLRQATISIEDKDFYHHSGVDIFGGIFRAIKDMIIYHHLEGGSTITQQLIKKSLLTDEQTVPRKIKEIILAFWTERIYSKDAILAFYLNRIPYGGTAYGVEEASEIYFNKHVSQLTLSESALLAGLPQAPTYYSPFGVDPERSIKRQHEVLDRMVENGYITKSQSDRAKKEKLIYTRSTDTIKAPHFVAYIRDQLVKKYGEQLVEQGGLKVTTSLDLDLQEFTQATLSAEIEKQKNLKVGNGAALITNPSTGEILTMIGSHDYDASSGGKVNVTLARRSPGSSIKPLVYALGFLEGVSTPATAWIDGKFCFPAFAGKAYCPGNYDGQFHGIVQSRFALGNSYNIPAVKQLALDKMEDFLATAAAMGISTFKDNPDRYGYSLALGGGEVKMVDMAEAFGVFANGGRHQKLVSILTVENSQGRVLENNSKKITRVDPYSFASTWNATQPWRPKDNWVLPQAVTFLISHILLDDSARASTFGSGSILNIPGKTVSVKTGTAEDKRDNWTIGYTTGPNSRLTVVWVGNNDNSPMSPYLESGNTGAAPIWNKLMTKALENIKPFFPPIPSGVEFLEICSLSGLLPDHDCPKRGEYFIKGFVPKEKDNVWGQKLKIQVFKDTHKQPGPNDQPAPDQLTEEEHLIISDPFQKNYCADCAL